jgi:hypothetical protein
MTQPGCYPQYIKTDAGEIDFRPMSHAGISAIESDARTSERHKVDHPAALSLLSAQPRLVPIEIAQCE